jgi:hypothetical protein
MLTGTLARHWHWPGHQDSSDPHAAPHLLFNGGRGVGIPKPAPAGEGSQHSEHCGATWKKQLLTVAPRPSLCL